MVTYFKSSDIHFHALRPAGFITVCTYGPCAGISNHPTCYIEPGRTLEVITRETYEEARAEALAHLGMPAVWLASPAAVDVAALTFVSVEELTPAEEFRDLPF